MHNLLKPFLLLTLVLGLSLGAHAAPVNFPDAEPAFTIETPKKWESKVLSPENLQISTGAGADTVMAVFGTAEEATDTESAKAYLSAFVEAMVPTLGLKDAKESAPAAEIPLNDKVNAVAQEFQAKAPSGKDMILTAALFSADGKKYYTMLIVGTKERTKATNDDQTAIMKSITPKG